MKDEQVVGKMASCSSEISPPHGANLRNDDDKQSNVGCLILLLLVIPLLDITNVLIMRAGRYCPVVFVVSLGGFAFGAALGGYVSVKVKHKPWFSSSRWAVYGLIGMCLTAGIASQAVILWQG